MQIQQRFYRFLDILFSKPQELHAFLVSAWILRFGSRPLSPSRKSAIVFSPHQDDETLGCGGVIAWKRSLDVPVSVVFLTDGQKSHLFTPWLESPQDIVQIRRQEALSALSVLGVKPTEVHFLDHMDGALAELEPEPRQQLIDRLVHLLQHHRPEEVYVPHRHDNHPDHEATYALVKAAIAQSQLPVQLWQYPIWLLWESLMFVDLKKQDLARAVRCPIHAVQHHKQQAIAAYQSQHLLLPPGMLNSHGSPYEIFFPE